MVDVRPADLSPEGVGEISGLLRTVFPKATYFTPGFVDWDYRVNPDGDVVAYNAFVDGVLAAHLGAQRTRARVFGEEVHGLLVHNGATHPEHRGKRLFTAVSQAVIEDSAERGFAFLWGVANDNSTYPLVKVGFHHVATLDARLGVGPTPARGAAAEVAFERLWSPDSLRWRVSCPMNRYSAKRGDGLGRVYADTGVLGIPVELGEVDARWVPADVARFEARNPVRLWVGLDPGRRWSLRPWANVPMRLRPAPLNFIFLDLRDRQRTLDPRTVRVCGLDFDAY